VLLGRFDSLGRARILLWIYLGLVDHIQMILSGCIRNKGGICWEGSGSSEDLLRSLAGFVQDLFRSESGSNDGCTMMPFSCYSVVCPPTLPQ
jgi:hypothetical protein